MGLFNRKKKDEKKEAQVTDKPVVKESAKKSKKLEKKSTAADLSTQKKKVTPVVETHPIHIRTARQLAAEILLEPVVTEKASTSGAYYFKVKPTTNKNEVKKAFTTLYGKTPRKVNIMNMGGKKVRFGRTVGRRADWKKAIVYMKAGESVDVFSE